MGAHGQGSIGRTARTKPGAPFPAGTADNGLSVDPVTGRIVLGSDLGNPVPGQLLSNREIEMNGNSFRFSDNALGANFLVLDPSIDFYSIGRDGGVPNAAAIALDAANSIIQAFINGVLYWNIDHNSKTFQFGDIAGVGSNLFLNIIGDTLAILDGAANNFLSINSNPATSLYSFGDINNFGNGFRLDIDDLNQTARFNSATGSTLELNKAAGTYLLGDITAVANGSVFTIDDTTGIFQIRNTAANASVEINNVPGFTGTVAAPATITVNGGIVTNVA